MAQRVTIAHIADAAGVSVPTVSKVVNGRSDVAPGTRERVERMLREHGYKRPAPQTHAHLLDVVFNELESPWAMEIIKGVEEVARENELGVVLSAQEGPGALGRSWVDAVASRRSAGLILVVSELTPEQIARLNARSIPFVVVDPAGEPAPGVPSVGATNWNGGLSATRHLLELGHTRIGMIGGPPNMLCSRARVDGYRAALETAGLDVDPELIRWGTFHVEAGYEHGQALLQLPEPPTAIFAGSDLQAFGVYEAARVHRRRHPRAAQRDRVRRPADGALGRAAADHDPPAADRDGGDGGSLRPRADRGPPRRARDDARGASEHN